MATERARQRLAWRDQRNADAVGEYAVQMLSRNPRVQSVYLSHDGEGVCLRAVVSPETTREEELALHGLALDLDARFPDDPFINLSVWNPRMFVGDLAYTPRPDDRCIWRRNTT